MTVKRSEASVLRECLRYLKAMGIFHLRMNVGAVKSDKRFVRFGTPGCADLLISRRWRSEGLSMVQVTWAECKSSTGKQSPAQTVFQRIVEAEDHKYCIVRSVEELIKALKEA